MAAASENPLPTPNSPQEYANGVTVDGGNLTIVSKELIKDHLPNEKQLPSCISKRAEPKSPHHVEAAKQVLQAQQEHIERVRESVEAMRGAVALAEPARQILAKEAEIALAERQNQLADQEIQLELKRRYLERLKATPVDQLVEGEAPTERPAYQPRYDSDDAASVEDPVPADASGIAFQAMSGESLRLSQAGRSPACAREARGRHEPEGCEATSRGARSSHRQDGDATRAPREPRAPMIKFSAATLMMIALRAAKDLPKASAYLCELESKLRPAEAEQKLKEDLYKDKGVAVVSDTLKTMDKSLGDLGFGYWMPFRYPDQWLMFGGLLQRVLAAHGLVPSGNAAIYRKLLEETPPITPVAADAGPPKSWGLSYRVREFQHMKDMLARIADVRAGRGPPL